MKNWYCSILVILVLCGLHHRSVARHDEADSLKKALEIAPAVHDRLAILYRLALLPRFPQAHLYKEELCRLSEKTNSGKGRMMCMEIAGLYARDSARYTRAIDYQKQALRLADSLGDYLYVTTCLNHIGDIYRRIDDYENALQYHLKALKAAETIDHSASIGYALSGIGNTYRLLRDYPQALHYLEAMLALEKKEQNRKGIAVALTGIGKVYYQQEQYTKALRYFNESLAIEESMGNTKGIAICLNDIGRVYRKRHDHLKALDCFLRALRLDKNNGDRRYLTDTHLNLGETYGDLGKNEKALYHLHEALNIARAIRTKSKIQLSYEKLSRVYAHVGNLDRALDCYHRAVTYKDSILSEEKNKIVAQLQARFDSEKQAAHIQLLEHKREAQDQEIRYQRMTSMSLAGGLGFILLVLAVLYRNNYQKKKANELLSLQNYTIRQQNDELKQRKEAIKAQNVELQRKQDEILLKNQELTRQKEEIEAQRDSIEVQHAELEEKNRNITASITYAKRIQAAMLPNTNYISSAFPQHFILFKPRDIVSGDFYWFSYKDNKAIIAAVDCTGHGVPGAFMSMIGNDLLNEIVNMLNITAPDQILNALHRGIRTALRQDETENRDGMDIALCVVDRVQKTLDYAGANNPLYLFQPDEQQQWTLREIKADKSAIGGSQQAEDCHFTCHRVDISVPTRFYIFSDGYQDQIGGDGEIKGRRFMTKRFKELLGNIHHQPMEVQKQILDETIESWIGKGNRPIDDILVMGVTIEGI